MARTPDCPFRCVDGLLVGEAAADCPHCATLVLAREIVRLDAGDAPAWPSETAVAEALRTIAGTR